jgi:hypothetical protein
MILPEPSQSTEVVVLGAGVAGLLISSLLAEHHEVIVLERRKSLPVDKYWLTDSESLDRNPDLAPAVDRSYKTLDFISASHACFRASGEYILWNTQALLNLLAKRLVDRGGKVIYSSRAYSYHLKNRQIQILYNDKAISAKLAIDCAGYQSPIAYSSGSIRVAGYYLLYGSTFSLLSHIEPVGLHNLVMDRRPNYVEAFPTNDGRVHLILITPSVTPGPIQTLRESFSFVLNSSPYRDLIDGRPSAGRSFLGGIIPVGRLSRRGLSRVFFFGESGQFNPPASATALTRLLHTYKEVGAHLSVLIEHDELSEGNLDSLKPEGLDWFNRRLQLGLFRSIMDWTSHDFDLVIQGLIRGGHNKLVNELLFGHVADGLGERVGIFGDLLRHRENVLLRALLRGLAGV